ncbi:MAG TPA: hypothetical protein PLG94_14700 [Smithellaceae bacterium]|nr:hypothetical protein [Smithellaceae bacterium]
MEEGKHFIGVGDTGHRAAKELCRIYEEMRGCLFESEQDRPHNHLRIHSYPCAETACFDDKDHLVILVGSLIDPGLQDARTSFHESRPYFMLTVGIDHQTRVDADDIQPLPDECLIYPDTSLSVPVKLAQLVLQIFLIHTPWYISKRGALIGYDLYDTKQLFGGKVVKAISMTSDRAHYRQNFSMFLDKNRADIRRTKGILMSVWGLSIMQANEILKEAKLLLTAGADELFTCHNLPADEPNILVTLFLAF